jgi:hypothetical protein
MSFSWANCSKYFIKFVNSSGDETLEFEHLVSSGGKTPTRIFHLVLVFCFLFFLLGFRSSLRQVAWEKGFDVVFC